MAAANLRSYTTDKDKPGLIYNDYCYREVTQKRAADGGIFGAAFYDLAGEG
jgi:hypothetical protein